jgi:threonyl-tRNA synthetase
MLIVGEKETKQKEISVRQQGEGDLGSFKINDFVKLINDKIDLDFNDLKI